MAQALMLTIAAFENHSVMQDNEPDKHGNRWYHVIQHTPFEWVLDTADKRTAMNCWFDLTGLAYRPTR